MTDTLPPYLADALVQVRVSSPDWSVSWPDGRNGTVSARLTINKSTDDNGIYPATASVILNHSVNGIDSTLYTSQVGNYVDTRGGFNSIKLEYDGVKARIFVGADEQHELVVVPFSHVGGELTTVLYAPGQWQATWISHNTVTDTHYNRMTNYHTLCEYLDNASDINEGIWTYLDSDLDTSCGKLDNRYTLATVAGDDGYDILVLDTSNPDAGLHVKGRILPTIFADTYDAEWITFDGLLLDRDVRAEFSEDHAILTIRFPLINSTLRFSRIIL